MKVYVSYKISDYAHPIAITTDRQQAEKYKNKYNKEDRYYNYFVDDMIISKAISEFSCS